MNALATLTIADTAIRTDNVGRFCLNDLHRAAIASGVTKDIRPNEWMALAQTAELAENLIAENPGNIPIHSKAGRYGGTYAVKELVYCYAMWISPAFHLKVIRAYDAMVTRPALAAPQTLPEALRLAADLAEGKAAAEARALGLEHQVEVLEPKAEALDRIAASAETLTITQAAKVLGVKRDELVSYLNAAGWVYRQNGSWVAYGQHIKSGCLQYKEANYNDDNTGLQCRRPYCHITHKGLAKLAAKLTARIAPS